MGGEASLLLQIRQAPYPMLSSIMHDSSKKTLRYEEIDLRALLAELYAQKAKLAAFVLAGLAAASLYLHVVDHKYRSEITVTPAQQGGGFSLSGKGSLGSLASLAGLSTPQGQGALLFSNYLENVNSMVLANELAQNPIVMKTIFRREWDEKKKTWTKPSGFLHVAKRNLKSVLGFPVLEWSPPNAEHLREYIIKEVTVEESSDKPFARISFKHKDRDFAEFFLNSMHESLEKIIRKKNINRASENIEYLTKKLGEVGVVEYRNAISQALLEQEKQLMLAQSLAPYAADPIGKAYSSSKPSSPNPIVIYICAIFVSIALFAFFALFSREARKSNYEISQ